jgi:hypothetical protein
MAEVQENQEIASSGLMGEGSDFLEIAQKALEEIMKLFSQLFNLDGQSKEQTTQTPAAQGESIPEAPSESIQPENDINAKVNRISKSYASTFTLTQNGEPLSQEEKEKFFQDQLNSALEKNGNFLEDEAGMKQFKQDLFDSVEKQGMEMNVDVNNTYSFIYVGGEVMSATNELGSDDQEALTKTIADNMEERVNIANEGIRDPMTADERKELEGIIDKSFSENADVRDAFIQINEDLNQTDWWSPENMIQNADFDQETGVLAKLETSMATYKAGKEREQLAEENVNENKLPENSIGQTNESGETHDGSELSNGSSTEPAKDSGHSYENNSGSKQINEALTPEQQDQYVSFMAKSASSKSILYENGNPLSQEEAEKVYTSMFNASIKENNFDIANEKDRFILTNDVINSIEQNPSLEMKSDLGASMSFDAVTDGMADAKKQFDMEDPELFNRQMANNIAHKMDFQNELIDKPPMSDSDRKELNEIIDKAYADNGNKYDANFITSVSNEIRQKDWNVFTRRDADKTDLSLDGKDKSISIGDNKTINSKDLGSFKSDTIELPSSVDQLTHDAEQSIRHRSGDKKEIAGKTGHEDSLGR